MDTALTGSVISVLKIKEETIKHTQDTFSKMLSLKEVEFQFWEKFSQFDNDDDEGKLFAAGVLGLFFI